MKKYGLGLLFKIIPKPTHDIWIRLIRSFGNGFHRFIYINTYRYITVTECALIVLKDHSCILYNFQGTLYNIFAKLHRGTWIRLVWLSLFSFLRIFSYKANLKKKIEWAKYIEQVIQFCIAFLFHNPAIKGNIYVAQGHIFDFWRFAIFVLFDIRPWTLVYSGLFGTWHPLEKM